MIGNTNGNWYLTVELFWFFWRRGVRYLSNCQKGRVYHLSFRGWDGRWFPSKLVGGVDRTCPSYLVISGSLFGYQQSNLEMEDMLQGLGKYWLWKMAIVSISLQIHRLRRCERPPYSWYSMNCWGNGAWSGYPDWQGMRQTRVLQFVLQEQIWKPKLF